MGGGGSGQVHVDHNYNWTNVNPDEVFEKLAKLGEGSYGAVWHIKHKELETTFAAKIIPVSAAQDREAASLMNEVAVLKACRSPHIVSYYGTLTHGGNVWVLMDFAAFGSLRDAMELCERCLTEQEIAAVASGALEGLAYLHANNISHLDVKAANILIGDDFHVKLADFGVSERVHGLDAASPMQNIIGTPFWIAPEIVLKRAHSNKSDIWSLGITAIELAERNPPGFPMNPYRYMQMMPNRPPPTLAEPEQWSTDFASFIAACLEKDPAKRPSCADLFKHPFVLGGKMRGSRVLAPLAEQILAARERKKAAASPSTAAIFRIPRPAPSPTIGSPPVAALPPRAASEVDRSSVASEDTSDTETDGLGTFVEKPEPQSLSQSPVVAPAAPPTKSAAEA